MKKRGLAIILCLATTLTLFGCSKGNETNTEVADSTSSTLRSGQMEINPADCVSELCDYKGIAVQLQTDYSISDAAVEDQVTTVLAGYGLNYVEVTDRTTIQADDYVKLDYVGYVDGEAFENGASQSPVLMSVADNMEMYSGSGFIPGFCDHLVGAEVGTTIDSPVTFPETYQNTDLAGKDAVFKLTIHGIYRKADKADLTDAMIAENFSTYDITTVDGLYDFMRKYLELQAENSRYTEVVEACEEYLLANCKVEVPADYVEARFNEYLVNFKNQYISDATVSVDDYLTSQGADPEEIKTEWKDALTDQVKLEMIFLYIAEKENIEFDQEGYDTFIQNYISNTNYGFETEADMYEYFGNGVEEEGKAYTRNLYLIREVIALVAEQASVTDVDKSAE